MRDRANKSLYTGLVFLFGLILLGCTELLDPEPTFSVKYTANGADSGTVPVDTAEYEAGTQITVAGNTGELVKASHTFAGWNTEADGTGTAYAENSSATMGDADMTFHAQWSEVTKFSVTYDGNGHTGGQVPVDASEYEKESMVTVLANTGDLIKTGYKFGGWNTEPNGSGTLYTSGETFSIPDGGITLYAKWISESTPTFTVTFDGNGHDSGQVPVDNTHYESEATVDIPGNTGGLAKSGFTFSGWNTAADGSGSTYPAGSNLTIGEENVILYARWIDESVTTYTVSYNGNGNHGGQPPVDPASYETGAAVILLDNSGGLSKSGYTFAGWNTEPAGNGTTYSPGSELTMGTANVVLYALWNTSSPGSTFFQSGPSQSNNSGYYLTIEMFFQLVQPSTSTVWFVLGEAGAAAPSASQIKAGKLGDGSAALASSENPGSENNVFLTIDPVGLEAATNYKVFVYGESTGGESSDVISVSVTIEDVPVNYFNTGPSVTPNGDGTATISFSSYKSPTPDLFYALYSKDSAPTKYGPVIQAILNDDTPAGAVQAGVFLSEDFPSQTYLDAGISNIDDGQYSLLIIARDAEVNTYQLVANYHPVVKDFSITADVNAPVFAVDYPRIILGFDNFGDTHGHFTFHSKLDEPGEVYYVVLDDGAAAPTSQEVVNGTGSGGTTPVLNVSDPIYNADTEYTVSKYYNDGLTAGNEYDLYAVAKDDAAGNISADPIKIDFAASTINTQAWASDGITPTSVMSGTEEQLSMVSEIFTVTSADATLNVSVDLSELDGSTDAVMYDDGTNGDATADDGAYSLDYLVPSSIVPGSYTLKATLSGTDKYGNVIETKYRSIGDLTVTYPGYAVTKESGSSLTTIVGDGAATNYVDPDYSRATLTLPFDVQFYGDTYTAGSNMLVHEMGGLSFGSTVSKFGMRVATDGATYATDETAGGNSVAPGIAVYHANDLDPSATHTDKGIWVKTEGTAPNREFIIEWNYKGQHGYTHDFQIRFYENAGDPIPDFRIAFVNMSTIYSGGFSMTAFKSDLQTSDVIVPSDLVNPSSPNRWTFTW